jgi:heat shock protein HspQ
LFYERIGEKRRSSNGQAQVWRGKSANVICAVRAESCLVPEQSPPIVSTCSGLIGRQRRPSGLEPQNGEFDMMLRTAAKYHIGQVLRHRKHPFRGVVFDVDAMFSNTDEWYENIPEEARPSKDQPFYHLLAENDQSYYVAYVSEQNLVPDETGEPVSHPDLPDLFGDFTDGRYPLQFQMN